MSHPAGPTSRAAWLWVPAPLPLLFGLIAARLGPEDAEEVAADLLLLVVFELGLPLLTAMATATMRDDEGPRHDLVRAGALLAAAAGGTAGIAVAAEPAQALPYAAVSAQIVAASCLPLYAASWFAQRVLRARRATAWGLLVLLLHAVGVLAALVAFDFGWAMAPRLGALGGAASTVAFGVAAVAARRFGPPRPHLAVGCGLAASWLVVAVAGAAVDAVPPERFLPWGLLDVGSCDRTALVLAGTPRWDVARILEIDLRTGAARRLPRAARTFCRAAGGYTALRLEGPLERLTGWRAGASLRATDGRRWTPLDGADPADRGRLVCSPATPHALWLDGPTATVWDMASGETTTLAVDEGSIAYPCFTTTPLGVLFRVDLGQEPPLPRRYVPLDGNPPLESDAAIDALRCNTTGGDPALRFRRPLPHSDEPWSMEMADGTTRIAGGNPQGATYARDGRVAVVLAGDGGPWIAIWSPGGELLQRWAVDDLSRSTISPDGEHVLLVQYRGRRRSATWRVRRTADGAIVARGTTSQVRWSDDGALIEVAGDALLRRDLARGVTVQLLPRSR